jgi:hypothetical protein
LGRQQSAGAYEWPAAKSTFAAKFRQVKRRSPCHRTLKHIPTSRFSLVLGFLALLGALGQLWRVDFPLLAICLLVIGASLVAKPWLTRTA